jgi:hypothetical protein
VRRIGVLLPAAPDDAEQQSWLGAFLQGLRVGPTQPRLRRMSALPPEVSKFRCAGK